MIFPNTIQGLCTVEVQTPEQQFLGVGSHDAFMCLSHLVLKDRKSNDNPLEFEMMLVDAIRMDRSIAEEIPSICILLEKVLDLIFFMEVHCLILPVA